METITFTYNDKEYTTKVERGKDKRVFIITSKGREYWLRKDKYVHTHQGWQVINNNPLPDDIFDLIIEELEKLL